MRYGLRTLLIGTAVIPPLLAGIWCYGADAPKSWLFWYTISISLFVLFAFVLGHSVSAISDWLDWLKRP
jgi:hypothetical protein